MWPNVVKYVKETMKKKKSEIPTSDSFVTDVPMIAFLATDLAELMRNLLSLVLKPDVFEKNKTPSKLAVVDVKNKENLLPAKKIFVGNATKIALESTKLSPINNMQFMDECRAVILNIIQKLQERCPLKYSLLRSLACLNPAEMAHNRESSLEKFRTLAKKLVDSKLLRPGECDLADQEYRNFCDEKSVNLEGFDPCHDRIDEFCHKEMAERPQYANIWKVFQKCLVLSHGQATVERGFSINDEMLVPNMQQMSLVARRIVYDTLTALDVDLNEFDVSESLLKHCSAANGRYKQYLMDKELTEKKETLKRKSSEVEKNLMAAKKRVKEIESQAQSCNEEADRKAQECHRTGNMALLTQSLSLRETAKKMMAVDLKKEQDKIKNLESELSASV